MKIALIEPNLSGHHKLYLESFYDVLLKEGISVDCFTPNDPNFKFISQKFYFKKGILKKINVIYNLFISMCNLIFLRLRVKGEYDGVFFCCIDDYINDLMNPFIFNLCFPLPVSGLLFKSRRWGNINVDSRCVFKSKYWKSIGFLDEFANDQLSRFNKYIIHFPDFADDSTSNKTYDISNEILNRAKNRKIVSVLGAIDKRKGIDNFISISKVLSDKEFFFVIAGKSFLSQEDTSEIINDFRMRENCFFYSELIPTESDFNRLIEISDVIYAAYINFTQSSNMLSKSIIYKKPLVVSKGFYMEEIVDKYKLGYIIDQSSTVEGCQAIKKAISSWMPSTNSSQYIIENSREQLVPAFKKVIEYFYK